MIVHETASEEIIERASLYASGALSAGEEAEFRAHAERCTVCAAEARAFTEAVSWLNFTAATPAPAGLRDRLLARIQQPQVPEGIRVVRADQGEWRPLMPGVAARNLNFDNASGQIAMLVRMEAGAQYPPHSHGDIEHCYVLQGDLRFGDLVLGPGDYQWANVSTNHRDSHTDGGCMVLIIASQRNTMLPWNR